MKERLLLFLACPACKGDLSLRADRWAHNEVIHGALTCLGCGAAFPIVRGIPRFVTSGSYAASFGFEWNQFSTVQLDSVSGSSESERGFAAKTGMTGDDVKGRLVLDAGVGAGRYADVVSSWGGEVIGVDLTEAVDAAFSHIGSRADVHLIQADLFALPFREEVFDIAYSIGVLHHTPDPAEAFRRVGSTIKNGGRLAVYLYPALGVARHFSDAIRKITTRLPTRFMFRLSALAVPLYYVYRLPVLGKLCQTVCPISLHANWQWRWLDTFDWYTPKYQFKFTYPVAYRWFVEAGFDAIQIFEEPICMSGYKNRQQESR
jgi:uncharacterized protein YbaR (Trm112 family)/ubiquinone/menaquinone biosynthesis C-methylase UbiE